MELLKTVETKAQDVLSKAKADLQLGIVGALFNFFQGRATTFAIVFTIVGIILAFKGKLDANFVALIAAIQALIVVHSWKEDVHDQRMARLESEGKASEDNGDGK